MSLIFLRNHRTNVYISIFLQSLCMYFSGVHVCGGLGGVYGEVNRNENTVLLIVCFVVFGLLIQPESAFPLVIFQ